MIARTGTPYIPHLGPGDSLQCVDTNSKKARAQARASAKCSFSIGDKVTVCDYRDMKDNYPGVVVAVKESIFGWFCVIDTPSRGRIRRGTASLKRPRA